MADLQIKKITTFDDMYCAQAGTLVHRHGLASAYHSEDPSIRTQIFKITLPNIPAIDSNILKQYNTDGQLHYIKYQNEDGTRIRHTMYLNAQHILTMSRSMLCTLVHHRIQDIIRTLQDELFEVDPALAARMQPDCIYRGGLCYKGDECCGYMAKADINQYQICTETKGE